MTGRTMAKKILIGLASVLVALLAAFLWGASGKAGLEDALERSTLRGSLLEARGGVLTARIALYNTNFGDASRSLEEARIATERAIERLHAKWEDVFWVGLIRGAKLCVASRLARPSLRILGIQVGRLLE